MQVGNRDFTIDLVFFHRGLTCLVAFELKVYKFEPADLGLISFYVEALDRDVKKPHERPSIGVGQREPVTVAQDARLSVERRGGGGTRAGNCAAAGGTCGTSTRESGRGSACYTNTVCAATRSRCAGDARRPGPRCAGADQRGRLCQCACQPWRAPVRARTVGAARSIDG